MANPTKTDEPESAKTATALRGRELRIALLRRTVALKYDRLDERIDFEDALRGIGDLDADALLAPLEGIADERKR